MSADVETDELNNSSGDRLSRRGRWAVMVYRIMISITAVVLFNQAVLAGQFMSGTIESLEFHSVAASVADGVVLLALIAAGVARFKRRYSWWPVGWTFLLLAALQGQEFAGEQRILTIHVPLGVFLIMSVSWLTIWAWRES
jgi:hypothetical protein